MALRVLGRKPASVWSETARAYPQSYNQNSFAKGSKSVVHKIKVKIEARWPPALHGLGLLRKETRALHSTRFSYKWTDELATFSVSLVTTGQLRPFSVSIYVWVHGRKGQPPGARHADL